MGWATVMLDTVRARVGVGIGVRCTQTGKVLGYQIDKPGSKDNMKKCSAGNV